MQELAACEYCVHCMYTDGLLKTKKLFRVLVTSMVIYLVTRTITHLKFIRRYFLRINSEITQTAFF
jgi:hypothetical protein